MIIETHRCIKCKTKYNYQKSGYDCDNELNNPQYCPECMKIINEALKNVPEKFYSEYLPIIDKFPKKISVEEFDKKFEKFGKDYLVVYPIVYEFDGNIRELNIDGVDYREYIGNNREAIITANYEVNKNGDITGLW